MLNKILSFLYFSIFTGLVGGLIYALYWFHPFILYFYVGCLVLMGARYGLGVENPLTKWACYCLTSLDQTWQVTLSPLLNIAPNIVHKFGHPDETASSVVGKNLQATGALHWKMIEWCLATILEGGKPHSIPAIEADEG